MLKQFQRLYRNILINRSFKSFSTHLTEKFDEMHNIPELQEKSLEVKIQEELDLPYNIFGNSIEIPTKVGIFWKFVLF